MDYKHIIGNNVRYKRVSRGMTIKELSEKIGIGQGFLGLVERGDRNTSLKNLCKIADYFGLTIDELITTDLSSDFKYSTDLSNIDNNPKLKKIESLLNKMNDDEIDFIVHMLKGFRKFYRKKESL